MNTIPLDKNKHNRKRFDCAVEPLNNYLKLLAQQHDTKDNTRTFILEDPLHPEFIMGYYTLTMTALNLNALPLKLQKKHQNAQAAGLIARLAVDKRYAKQGHGEWLLIDALHKLLAASDSVAFPIIMVDGKQGIAKFYEKMGFSAFLDEPNKLFMTLTDVRYSLGNP